MSDYQLYHGDCLALLPALEEQSIDCVVTDIPSGRTACAWDSVIPFDLMWAQLRRIIKPRGAIVLLGCTQPFTSALIMSNLPMFKYEWIWRKGRPSGHLNAKRRPMNAHESIPVFSRGAHVYNPQRQKGNRSHALSPKGNTQSSVYGAQRMTFASIPYDDMKYPITILDIPKAGARQHPTQKPRALLDYLVKTYSNPGDRVLDFCFGSGTTGESCAALDRCFVGMELYPLLDRPIHPKHNPDYYNLGSERIASAYAPLQAMQEAAA